jgi:hypothetical protein
MNKHHEGHDRHRRAAVWIAAASSRNVVRRAMGYAFGVGALLIAINHGDAVLAGRLDAARVVKMALTMLVPYCVSTASSVGALLASPRDDTAPHKPRG